MRQPPKSASKVLFVNLAGDRQQNNSYAEFSKIPINECIPDEFEYRYGEEMPTMFQARTSDELQKYLDDQSQHIDTNEEDFYDQRQHKKQGSLSKIDDTDLENIETEIIDQNNLLEAKSNLYVPNSIQVLKPGEAYNYRTTAHFSDRTNGNSHRTGGSSFRQTTRK